VIIFFNVFFADQVFADPRLCITIYCFGLSSFSAVRLTLRVCILIPWYTRDRVFQMFAALSVMTACTMAIPIFVEGGPRSQSSESAENYVSIIEVIANLIVIF